MGVPFFLTDGDISFLNNDIRDDSLSLYGVALGGVVPCNGQFQA